MGTEIVGAIKLFTTVGVRADKPARQKMERCIVSLQSPIAGKALGISAGGPRTPKPGHSADAGNEMVNEKRGRQIRT
jgi:hypothetical protein